MGGLGGSMRVRSKQDCQSGVSLIEVLVTLIVVAVGLLGLVGLLLQSQRAQMESYQRVQAISLMEDMVSRIQANKYAAVCYAVSDDSGSTFLGVDSTLAAYQEGSSAASACTAGLSAEQRTMAMADLRTWNSLLLGAAEQTSSNEKVGAMLGARGCVQQIAANTYQVSVVWQGMADTATPAGVNCASADAANLFGSAARRRAVSATVQVATLN